MGLTRVPEFGYDLDLSLASAALVPLVKEWLDGAVRDLVLQVRPGQAPATAGWCWAPLSARALLPHPTHHNATPCAVQQPYVLPEHFFFPLDPGIGDVERPAGVLAVTVERADNVSLLSPVGRRRRRRCAALLSC